VFLFFRLFLFLDTQVEWHLRFPLVVVLWLFAFCLRLGLRVSLSGLRSFFSSFFAPSVAVFFLRSVPCVHPLLLILMLNRRPGQQATPSSFARCRQVELSPTPSPRRGGHGGCSWFSTAGNGSGGGEGVGHIAA
jgi:hypothetical protein